MAKTIITREGLYDLVWSEYLAAISRKYNISYQCLREVCNEMWIPLPPNGYWSKLQFGKEVEKLELPEAKNVQQEISLWLRTDEDGEEYISKNTTEFALKKSEIVKKLNTSGTTKKKLHIVDPLFTLTKENYSQKDSRNWNYNNRNVVFSISTSKAQIPRALRLVEKFMLLMKECGHSVIVENGLTYALIEGEKLQIYLSEKQNRITSNDGKWPYSQLVYNGKLSLKYYVSYATKECSDSSTPLEDKLLDVIAKLELIAQNEKKARAEREKYWAERELIEQKKKAYQETKDKELRDFKSVLKQSKRYRKTIDLRNYIDKVEENAITNNSLTVETKQWIEWARKKADWFDPFIEANDELMEGINKDNLT